MALELEGELHKRIELLAAAAENHCGAGEFDLALELYSEALGLVPEPKEEWEASTWLWGAIADAHFQREDFAACRDAGLQAMRCPGAIGNPFLHLRLGQAQFEVGNLDRAKDELARAFMGAGDAIFEDDNPKYLRFIREVLRPPAHEVGE